MALQLSVACRNALLDAIETTVGASAILKVFTGAPPASCAAADSGTVLATMQLPADWLNNAIAGSKAQAGTWQDTSADDDGEAGHFRIYNGSGSICHLQGTITESGGGGDIIVNDATIVSGNPVVLPEFAILAQNS